LIGAIILSSIGCEFAWAQDVSSRDGIRVDPETDEIIVTGVRASLSVALDRKKSSANFLDSIEAEDIGRFPDINIAEALQRVPGVSLERSVSGVSRTVTVRGLSSLFSLTELNGMQAATGSGGRSGAVDFIFDVGADGRAFDFGVLPNELIQSLVVSKSPKASDTEGGIAAIIDVSTPDPFSLPERFATASASAVLSEQSDAAPRFSGLAAKQFNEKVAVLVGGVYSRARSSTGLIGFDDFDPLSERIEPGSVISPSEAAAVIPLDARFEQRLRDTQAVSALATVSLRPVDRVSFRLDGFYSRSRGDEFTNSTIFDIGSEITPSVLSVESGVIAAARLSDLAGVDFLARSDAVEDEFQHYTLNGNVALGGGWTLTPFLGYSARDLGRPFDQASFSANGENANFQFDLNQGVDGFSTDIDFLAQPELFANTNVLAARRADDTSRSEDFAVSADLAKPIDRGPLKALRFGVRYNTRKQDVTEPFRGALNFSGQPSLDQLANFTFIDFTSNANAPEEIFGGNPVALARELLSGQDVLDPDFDISQTLLSGIVISGPDDDTLATSSVDENVLAGYVESSVQIGPVKIDAGLRIVNTRARSQGATQLIDGTIERIDVEERYTNLLPAINIRYDVNGAVLLRGAYSRALSRPTLQDIAPRETINFNEPLMGSIGNPALDPFIVNQFDIGVEWYPRPESFIGLALFRKQFTSIIGTDFVELSRLTSTTVDPAVIPRLVEFEQPVNTGSAQLTGFELSAQTDFFFATGALKNAGVILNYSRLDSSLNLPDDIDNVIAFPFPNLSPSSLNAGLYYDNGRFDIRLNYAWREGFVRDAINPANALRQSSFGQLDLSANYKVKDYVTLQAQLTNLTDERLEFQTGIERVLVQSIELERRLTVGFRVSL